METSRVEARTPARVDLAFLAFAAVFFVFHQFPSIFLTYRGEAAVDVLTPYAVVASTLAVMLALGASRGPLPAAVLAGVMYLHGQDVHLAATRFTTKASRTTSSTSGTSGSRTSRPCSAGSAWWPLAASPSGCRRARSASPALLGLAALLLGWTFFTSTVEGQTWWLELPAAAVFVVWAWREPRPLLRATAGAFALAALLIAGWAIWHGGVPEFSEL